MASASRIVTLEDQWLLQKEKTLAWVRLGFSLAALLVVQLNPLRVAKFPLLSHISLFSFFFYSLLVLYLIKKEKWDSRVIGLVTTFLDILWISLMVFSTGGSRAPFFVYYLFPVITASSRYGIKGGLLVALAGAVLYGFIRFSPFWENPLAIDTFIIRTIYLFMLAYIFGFLSEFEKKQNQKLMALYKTAGEAATQEERRRIARELHDRLLQVLASLTLRLETCRRHLMDTREELSRELELMEQATRNSMEEIRRFLTGKDSQDFTPGILIEKLKEEMRFLRDGLGLQVVLESEPEDLTLPSQVEEEIYYVLREGLSNIARHSQASSAELLLTEAGAEVRGSLKDDGVGFDLSAARNGGGFGLISMEERINKLGGELSIETSPGKGTRISFRAPLRGENVAVQNQ
ncbi:MAG: sensor histidine kinase [Deltaproteobacteria bacterium]|nr:sensor histidine kinase [Deltaproteobacteria bacterium]